MADFAANPRNRVMRYPKRAAYDTDTVNAILDEGLVCHVSFVMDGQPLIIPTIHARMGDQLLLHGLKGGRMLEVAVTLLDGLVLARTVFNHSMNYRSVVLFGRGASIEEPTQKLEALRCLTEHVCRGRWADARPPTEKELQATTIVAIDIEDASAKIRKGPPGDAGDELEWPTWAGVLPLPVVPQPAETDPRQADAFPVPAYVRDYRR